MGRMAEMPAVGPRDMVAVAEAEFGGDLRQGRALGQPASRGLQAQAADIAGEAGAEGGREAVAEE
jgi:hypothetical protein